MATFKENKILWKREMGEERGRERQRGSGEEKKKKGRKRRRNIYAKEKTVDFRLDCHVKNLFQVLVVVEKSEESDGGDQEERTVSWEEVESFSDVCRKSRSCRLCKFSSIPFL